jgi:UDP-N-acetyl-D-mannosaminuronate dehydrogenase
MTIEQLLRARKAVVGVIGLGYVGLPLVRLFAAEGIPRPGVRHRSGEDR